MSAGAAMFAMVSTPATNSLPARAPARTKPKAELHDLNVTLPLGGSNRLLLNADPAGSSNVGVVLVAGDTDELRACEALVADGLSRPLALGPFTKESVRAGAASLLALRAQIPLATVRAIGRSTDPVTLRGCGQSVELDDAARDVLARFTSVAKRALGDRPEEAVAPPDVAQDRSATPSRARP